VVASLSLDQEDRKDITMNEMLLDEEMTRDTDLASWRAFSLAYYEPIRRALRLIRVPEDEVDELANSFILKAAEKRFLEKYQVYQQREQKEGRRARFRTYLYRSLQHHVVDAHRRRTSRAHQQGLAPAVAESLVAEPDQYLDPDALYALDVLHQALQAMRRHCERTGKSHIWAIFEELLLAEEFRGRKGQTREEMAARYPGAPPRFLDNCLTTAKRTFRRFIQEVVPRGLREDVPAAERFQEWMSILRDSNASQFNLLHVAYQVTPHLTADMSQAASTSLVVDQAVGTARYEEPSLLPNDDELSLLLSFRLELPLSEMLDSQELQLYIPLASRLWPPRKQETHLAPAENARHPSRPLCLLTLIDPTPDEAKYLQETDLIGLLNRLKSLAKQLRRRPDHAMPEVFAQLLYTTVNVLALVRCDAQLHTIGGELMAGNIRWFLGQPWLDDRLRPLLQEGQALLEACRSD
jgi:DNA-directed RNA polymerase specialized sigma24 family protein